MGTGAFHVWNSSFHYAVTYIFLGQISVSPAYTPGLFPTQEGHTVILGFNERTHLVLKVGALRLVGLLGPSRTSRMLPRPPSLFGTRGTGC